MGTRFGEIEIDQILQNEFRIEVLEKIIDRLLQKNRDISGFDEDELIQIKKNVVESLKNKYPKSGLELKL